MQGSEVDSEITEVIIDGVGMKDDVLPWCVRHNPDISWRHHNHRLEG